MSRHPEFPLAVHFVALIHGLEAERGILRGDCFAFAENQETMPIQRIEKQAERLRLQRGVEINQHVTAENQLKFVQNAAIDKTVLKKQNLAFQRFIEFDHFPHALEIVQQIARAAALPVIRLITLDVAAAE